MFLQTNDPILRISLDNYESIFSVTPHGIARYLTLVKPVDREEQKSYSFTVRSTQAQVISISSFLIWTPLRIIETIINNRAQFDKIQVLQLRCILRVVHIDFVTILPYNDRMQSFILWPGFCSEIIVQKSIVTYTKDVQFPVSALIHRRAAYIRDQNVLGQVSLVLSP